MLVQEFELCEPLSSNLFCVEKRGLGFKAWAAEIGENKLLGFYHEEMERWCVGIIRCIASPDSLDCRYVVEYVVNGEARTLKLYSGMLVRVNAPTDEELRARFKQCDAFELVDGERVPCREEGQQFISLYEVAERWYCEKHQHRAEGWTRVAQVAYCIYLYALREGDFTPLLATKEELHRDLARLKIKVDITEGGERWQRPIIAIRLVEGNPHAFACWFYGRCIPHLFSFGGFLVDEEAREADRLFAIAQHHQPAEGEEE